MDKLTLKSCVDVIDSHLNSYQSPETGLFDVWKDIFSPSGSDMEWIHRKIIRFSDFTWGDYLPDYLLPKDGSGLLEKFFEQILDPRRITDVSQKELADKLLPVLALDGYTLASYKFPLPNRVGYKLRKISEGMLITLDDDQVSVLSGDSFSYQFPAGLPFGIKKPNMAFIPEKGTQKPKFESDENIGLIKNDIYPCLNYGKLNKLLEKTPFLKEKDLLSALYAIIQTDSEKKFFASYQSQFKMSTNDLPVLIPQAWIQWHSLTKKDLRSQSSAYIDDLYRVDFVAFWNNKRFAILLDDISHYAKKIGTSWQADEKNYSKRLKEDRKLRKEGWNVFRTSNWEMRNEIFVNEALNDLQHFIAFEIPKPPEIDDIPF